MKSRKIDTFKTRITFQCIVILMAELNSSDECILELLEGSEYITDEVILELSHREVQVPDYDSVILEIIEEFKVASPSSGNEVICPTCGSPTFYLYSLRRYYCFRCKKYVT